MNVHGSRRPDAGDPPVPEEDPLQARFVRAAELALRFVFEAAPREDYDTALAELEELVELDVHPDRCRILSAHLLLHSALPAELRQASLAEKDLTRFLWTPRPVPDDRDAERALAHLESVTDPELHEMAAALQTFTRYARTSSEFKSSGRVDAGELPRLTSAINSLLAETSSDDQEGITQLTVLRDALHALPDNADAQADPDFGPLVSLLEQLGEDHPLSSPLLDFLRSSTPGLPGEISKPEAIERAYRTEDAFWRLPDHHPARTALGIRTVLTFMPLVAFGVGADLYRRAFAVIDAVEPTATGRDAAVLGMMRSSLTGAAILMNGEDMSSAEAIEGMLEHADTPGLRDRVGPLSIAFSASILARRFMRWGRREDLDAATSLVAKVPQDETGELGDAQFVARYFLAFSEILTEEALENRESLEKALSHLRDLPVGATDDFLRGSLPSDMSVLTMLSQGIGPDGPDLEYARASGLDVGLEAAERALARADAMPRDHVLFPLELLQAGAAFAHQGFVHAREDLTDRGLRLISDARDAAEEISAGDLSWTVGFITTFFGTSLLMNSVFTRRPSGLDAAINQLRKGISLLEELGEDTQRMSALKVLGDAHYLRNDPARKDTDKAVRLGLEYLRESAWQVVLQKDLDKAATVAAGMAGEAAEIARWALTGGLDAVAVEALELGRNMALYTATADRNITGLLAGNGHAALAEEWLRAQEDETSVLSPRHLAHDIPGDLRQRVRQVIRGTDVENRLWSRTGPAEVAAALRAADASVLVYLIPRSTSELVVRQAQGMALVIDTEGLVHRLPLPGLRIEPVAEFSAAQRDRVERVRANEGRRDETDEERAPWRRALDRLCRWAWVAAMGPLCDWATEHGLYGKRLVLVPLDGLSQVPWHAAVRELAGGRSRAVCQDFVISYAASGRQFAEAARIPPRPWTESPALVDVPDSSLFWARKEIKALREREYPGAALLNEGGRRARGTRRADPEAVASLIPDASLVHLSCHASPAPRPVDSTLTLVSGEKLKMEQILDRARKRPGNVAGGLVLAMACGSDLSHAVHDESLTLASAFLAAGACGAVGSRWIVDDLPAAAFTALFHHYLNHGYPDPSRALQAAQAWMLESDGDLPPGLAVDFSDELSEISLSAPEAWAAFAYQGR